MTAIDSYGHGVSGEREFGFAQAIKATSATTAPPAAPSASPTFPGQLIETAFVIDTRLYRSTLHVQPVADTGGAFLSRHASFDPAEGATGQEATTVLEAAYAPAVAGLHTIIA
ncbi:MULTISPECIES: hypothetical protein [Streptomyces]|uniref:hypothetical protein n=1 Tax=Streptomyces TaxID=1883 RepID=UPI000689B64A|nr:MULTISPECIES: hypothetical protein [Streptomyces]